MPTLLLTERELNYIVALLVESKKEEFLKKKYNVDDDVISKVKETDPTPNNKYMEWLIKRGAANQRQDYRRETIHEFLSYYTKDKIRKSLPKEYQDINGFKTIDEFIGIMGNVNIDEFVSKTEALEQTYVGSTENYRVYKPDTYAQSCIVGSGTNWCTAADSRGGRSSFESYTKNDNELYIFINKKDKTEKFQFSTKEGLEFKDVENQHVSNSDIKPEIKEWISEHLIGKIFPPYVYKFITDMEISENIDIFDFLSLVGSGYRYKKSGDWNIYYIFETKEDAIDYVKNTRVPKQGASDLFDFLFEKWEYVKNYVDINIDENMIHKVVYEMIDGLEYELDDEFSERYAPLIEKMDMDVTDILDKKKTMFPHENIEDYLYEKYGYRNKNELYREINSYFYKKYYDEYVEKFKNNPLETYLELDDLGYVNFKDLGNQIKFNSDKMVDDMAEANKLYTFLLYKFEKNPDLAGVPNEGQKDGYYLIHIFYP